MKKNCALVASICFALSIAIGFGIWNRSKELQVIKDDGVKIEKPELSQEDKVLKKVFRTVTLGFDPTKEHRPKRNHGIGRRYGIAFGEGADELVSQVSRKVLEKPGLEMEVDLVVITPFDLGFKNGSKLKDFYAKAKEIGLDLCPPQVGLVLRGEYEDQPCDDYLVIAMEPIIQSYGHLNLPHILYIGNDGKSDWIKVTLGDLNHVWPAVERFVFVLPRK
jgi:hypothetical protein